MGRYGALEDTYRSSSMVNDFWAPVTGEAKLSFIMKAVFRECAKKIASVVVFLWTIEDLRGGNSVIQTGRSV